MKAWVGAMCQYKKLTLYVPGKTALTTPGKISGNYLSVFVQ
jgi:hypothetical protein